MASGAARMRDPRAAMGSVSPPGPPSRANMPDVEGVYTKHGIECDLSIVDMKRAECKHLNMVLDGVQDMQQIRALDKRYGTTYVVRCI